MKLGNIHLKIPLLQVASCLLMLYIFMNQLTWHSTAQMALENLKVLALNRLVYLLNK